MDVGWPVRWLKGVKSGLGDRICNDQTFAIWPQMSGRCPHRRSEGGGGGPSPPPFHKNWSEKATKRINFSKFSCTTTFEISPPTLLKSSDRACLQLLSIILMGSVSVYYCKRLELAKEPDNYLTSTFGGGRPTNKFSVSCLKAQLLKGPSKS